MPEKLTEAGHDVYRMPMGTNCLVHKHTEWEPIERHHLWPLGMGGPDVDSNKISVCANGHYSIHEFIRQLMLHDGVVPASTAKHFNAKVRAYATQGWTEAGRPVHGNPNPEVPGQLEIPQSDD
jgi:hypothetical protein